MSKYTGSYEGIGEMLRSDFLLGVVAERGERVLETAISTAPVYSGRSGDSHRGRYKASFYIRNVSDGGSDGNRACSYVGNSAPEAMYVEFGTINNPPHATLRRALSAAGD